MQDRHGDGPDNLRGQLVHRIGADQQGVRSGGLQSARGLDQYVGGAIPITGRLHCGDRREVRRPDQKWRRMLAAEAFSGQAVEPLVVDTGAFPAHAAQETKGFHDETN